MRGVFVVALALLTTALAPWVVAADAAPSDIASASSTVSYVILLKDQRSHEASLAVRAVLAPAIDALADQRASLVRSPADLTDPEVLDLNRQIDEAMGDMRIRIASEALRLHGPSRAVLESFAAELGGTVTYRSPLLNLLVVRVSEDRVDALRAHPLVASIEREGTMDVLLDVSVPSIAASSFWGGGVTGGPFKIIVPDTGIDGTHPALVGEIGDAQTFHDAGRLQGNYADDWTTTDDLHGHGTHIAGIVDSQDPTYRGVAHGMLGVVNVKFGYVCDSYPGCGQGQWSDAWKGIDWSIFTAGGDVLTFSYGGGFNNDGTDSMSLFMDALVDDLGIPVSAAAGNNGGPSGTIIQPATAYNLVTVGAIDDGNSPSRGDDTIAGFSSRGPTGDGRLKPDIVAPGSDILSTAHDWETSVDWVGFWGTSMASPHVGASLLLYLQSAGGPPMFPARAKAVLLNTATDWGGPGPDTTYGWGYLDLATAWVQRNNVVQGDVAPGAAAFYRVTAAPGDKATLVWHRHVVYDGINAPTQWLNLNNVDLALYDETSQTRLGLSARPRDNVEQVIASAPGTDLVKVFAPTAFVGVAQEPFALAAATTLTAVAPPNLDVVVTAPPSANTGQGFPVRAEVTNTGALRIASSSVTLNLPPGVSLLSGANPTNLGPIPAGTTRSATWTVSTTSPGVLDFTANALGTAYEETVPGFGGPAQVTVIDTLPPTIASATAVPSPQNLGAVVNVSAAISDNVGVAGAWVEVRDPLNVLLGNFSMTFDLLTGRRFFGRPYATIGAHDYWISAADATGNWATASGRFWIADLEAPVLSSVTASPDPQEVHFSVNVTGTATDNVGVVAAFLEVWDPLGGSTNASMARVGSLLFLERPYDLVGTYTYFVSVRDGVGNWDDYRGAFSMRDTTRPTAVAGPDQTVEAGTLVAFDASASSDNVAVVSYVWTFLDGGPWTLPGATASHTFTVVGTYVITLTVQDAAGNTGTDTLLVTVEDPRPPVIEDVRADPPLQDVGGVVTVSARVTDAFGVAAVWLHVQDPQGGVSNGSMVLAGPRYSAASPYLLKGVYLFEIWASDLNGNWADARGGFRIADLTAPRVTVAVSPEVDIFSTALVTARVVENDALEGVVLEVRDPFGGSLLVPMALVGTEWQASIAPSVLGIHALTVWAEDVSGNLGSGAATARSVDRLPPVLAATAPATVEVLDPMPFTIDASDNLGVFVATLEVRDPSGASLGNRTLLGSSPFAVTIRATAIGLYRWTAHAMDPSGNRAVVTGTVDARDTQAPVADAGPDRTVVQGTDVPLDGSGSTDNFGIGQYTWTFPEGGPLRGARTSFAFRIPGVYTVELTVSDWAGNSDEDEARITVVGADADGDGSWDDNETSERTDPNLPDTDGDGMLDGEDLYPRSAAFDVGRLFASWFGVLILLVVFLVLLTAGFLRRRKQERSSRDEEKRVVATAAKVATARTEPTPLPPPPPEDEGLPPPPTD